MECLVFSSDGVLRVKMTDKSPSLPLAFVQEQSKSSELRFMSQWLSKKVIFESGLTIGKFLNCLEPFQNYLNEYLGKDISSYIKESKKPILVEDRLDFEWITLFHQYTISEQNEYISVNQNLELKEKKQRVLSNKWKIYENYMLSAYKNNDNEYYSIEKYPIQKIQHIPLFLDKESRIIINQKDIKNHNQEKGLLNPNAFGVMKQSIDENYNIEYLLTDKEHIAITTIEGFFKFFSTDIASREYEQVLLEGSDDEETQDQEDQQIETLKLKIHGGYYNQLMEEIEEKNQEWSGLVKKASQQQKMIKIGFIREGIQPEKKMFGLSIVEEIKKIKLD